MTDIETPEQSAFRADVRAFITDNLPAETARTFHGAQRHSFEQMIEWHRILGTRGWSAPSWPQEHGGPGWTHMQQHIFDCEAMAAGAPRLRPFGTKMIGPVLMRYGSAEQKARYLPHILAGSEYWCQGFSEPGAGSDLASLKTKAVRTDDGYCVTGQKTWTTTAQHADWMFALVRTDPDAERPQKGISMVLIDMAAPGVKVKPIITMDGDHHVNDVFLDNVHVPFDQLVGEENAGWTYAKYLLASERATIANVGQSKAELGVLKRIAAGKRDGNRSLLDDDAFATRLIDLEADLTALELTNLRMLSSLEPGKDVGAISSFLKLRGTEVQQRIAELAMDAASGGGVRPVGMEDHAADAYGTHGWLYSRAFSIFGGSSEIQKNIVAKQVLGLGG